MYRYLNPFRIKRAASQARRIKAGGGPRSVALKGFSEPRGWLVPHTVAELEVAARDGSVARFEPAFPLPLPVAYGYRLANVVGAPVISAFDPGSLRLRIPVRR